MGITCNGICHRYRAKKPVNMGRYTSGQKRCNSCEIYLHWDGLMCPCCNYRLRQSPRSGKAKEKILKIKQNKEKGVKESAVFGV